MNQLLQVGVIDCVFKRRLNRFVGEALVNGKLERIHITNTGRLEEYLVDGRNCLVIPINGRKLKYRLVAVEDTGGYAIIDTRTQSRAFEAAVERSLICGVEGCRIKGKEPRVGNSKFDYLLECSSGKVLVETKSAVLRGPHGEAMYPDCPSDRGLRHINHLIELHRAGRRVAIIFTAALPGATCFKPYREGDPRIYDALGNAHREGVPILAYSIRMTRDGRVLLENPCLPLCSDWIDSLRSSLTLNSP